MMLVFGPIPSRRLGQSLGINNIPPKHCPYSCTYCQIGRTDRLGVQRREFYKPEDIFRDVEERLKQIKAAGGRVDYLSFVPDGEPTLDINLGREIELLKPLGVKIAVIANAALLWMEDVRRDLMKADWVSIKIDSVDENQWKQVDRPHGQLNINDILKGVLDFAREFKGILVTETMLVSGVNDDLKSVERTADFLAEVNPSKVCIMAPSRPPAEGWVKKPDTERLREIFELVRCRVSTAVECITGNENGDYFFSGDIESDLLSITSVHPVGADAVEKLLKERNSSVNLVRDLVNRGLIEEFTYEGRTFYTRKIAERGRE